MATTDTKIDRLYHLGWSLMVPSFLCGGGLVAAFSLQPSALFVYEEHVNVGHVAIGYRARLMFEFAVPEYCANFFFYICLVGISFSFPR
jgi:hypothetical protein